MKYLASLCLSALLFLAASCGSGTIQSSPGPTPTPIPTLTPTPTPTPAPSAADITAVKHVIVLMQENRSFDHYFGFMSDYRHKNGIPINSSDGAIRDLSDPASLGPAQSNFSPARGGNIVPYHTGSICTEDLSPDWAEAHHEMNRVDPGSAGPGAPMDGFANTAKNLGDFLQVLVDTDGHRAMGIFDETQLNYYYAMASNFAMSDEFFSPIPTRTGSNRLFMHAATSAGRVHADSAKGQLTTKTIWRALDEAGVSWKIYISDWGINNFTFFNFFTDSNDPARRAKIVSIDEYFADVNNGTLPQVALIETGMNTGRDEHPTNNPGPGIPVPESQAINIQRGAAWIAQLMNALMFSPSWKDSAFFFAFDEGGGAFDHVPPISVPNPDGIKPVDFNTSKDCFNKPCEDYDLNFTGFRVPNFIVSPFAKKNYVSHTPMDYTAILKFIETRFHISPLTARDAAMPDMTEFFDFNNGGPWATPPPRVEQRRDGVCDYSKE
ncbi:MAG TPA: alkaline phosphatase family protein [Candidatus Sulfotelmatobacter sp.]|nr:alkaline phosphatase family protein [Candidatus Sulfotelmatobacter sp.]